jgi:hypothetical protein
MPEKPACQLQIGDYVMSESDGYDSEFREIVDMQFAGYDLSSVAIWVEELDAPIVMHRSAICSVQNTEPV